MNRLMHRSSSAGLGLLACSLLPVAAQTTPPAATKPTPQTFSGCVARIPNTPDKYVLSTGDRCMLLNGKYNAAAAADHEITATGILIDPTGFAPLTLDIQSVAAIRAACTRTCVLDPPGTRGIHGKERPGKEGGTPGLTTTPGTTPQP